jgi:hypothetical protein
MATAMRTLIQQITLLKPNKEFDYENLQIVPYPVDLFTVPK